MEKIILLAADRSPAQGCLEILAQAEKKGLIELKAVVSEAPFKKRIKKLFKGQVIFFENGRRNEDKIYQTIKDNNINLLISIQYKWIIPEKIIHAVKGLAFNIHFGKLPEYRGHHQYVHLILEGKKDITTTIHWMTPKVDTGYIAFEKRSPIKKHDTSWSLMKQGAADSIKLFKRLITCLTKNKPIPQKPIRGIGHYYGINSIFKLKKIHSLEDFNEVDKKARAFYFPPHEPAYFVLKGQKFYIIPKLEI